MEEFQEQHAIPQQISAYQFRLVGDMTLKQFFQLAAGALVSLLIYATNLPVYVKWPFIFTAFLIGVAFAFFPLEDRPLEKWIFLFMRSVYSPTVYLWNKAAVLPNYFKPEDQVTPSQLPETPPMSEEVGKISETVQQKETKLALEGLEEKEKEFLSNVEKHLQTSPKREPKIEKAQVPQNVPVKTEPTDTTDEQSEDVYSAPSEQVQAGLTPILTHKQSDSTSTAKYSSQASPPLPPTSPNIVVGQVLGASGEIVDGAILEIRDDLGRPTRAIKSNKLGHFMIVTPLMEGKYQILTEKDSYQFDPVTFEAKDEVIEPIAIVAKRRILDENMINRRLDEHRTKTK